MSGENSKSEIRNSKEIQSPKLETWNIDLWMRAPLTPALSPC
jgi:hypothetical protein